MSKNEAHKRLIRIIERRGHGCQKQIIEELGLPSPTFYRFKKTGSISDRNLAKILPVIRRMHVQSEKIPSPAPGTEPPNERGNPTERLSVALQNASLMMTDSAPIQDKLDALEVTLRYITDTVIPEIRSKK